MRSYSPFAVFLISLFVASVVLEASGEKFPPLPERVKSAKTIYIENRTTYSDVFNHLYEPLATWDRWKIVGDPAQADLRLILTRTAPSGKDRRINRWWFLVLTEKDSETPLLYISADIAIGGAKSSARLLVKKLQQRIENAAP